MTNEIEKIMDKAIIKFEDGLSREYVSLHLLMMNVGVGPTDETLKKMVAKKFLEYIIIQLTDTLTASYKNVEETKNTVLKFVSDNIVGIVNSLPGIDETNEIVDEAKKALGLDAFKTDKRNLN